VLGADEGVVLSVGVVDTVVVDVECELEVDDGVQLVVSDVENFVVEGVVEVIVDVVVSLEVDTGVVVLNVGNVGVVVVTVEAEVVGGVGVVPAP
jgi:hypothetical protein